MNLRTSLVVVLFAAGCSGTPPPPPPPGCAVDADCLATQTCTAGACVARQQQLCVAGQSRPCGPEPVGACRKGTQRCVAGLFGPACEGQVTAAAETCNGVDDDCDGTVDNGAGTLWFTDADLDGFGSAQAGAPTMTACAKPAGFADSSTDCNDSAATGFQVHPGAAELCAPAGVDENCNGTVDEGCGCAGVGQTQPCCAGRGAQTCEARDAGTALSACSVLPSTETCNGVDDDCDGQVDELAPVALGDGGSVALDGGATALGDGTCRAGVGACLASGVTSCSTGALACSAAPAMMKAELCNGLDDDCDGQADEPGPGLCAVTGQLCTTGSCACPTGQSICSGACATLTAEVCDGIDNDCDGQVDEALTIACSADPDADGYASSTATTQQCPDAARPQAGSCPVGHVAPAQSLGLDCQPTSGAVYRLVSSRSDADTDGACVGAAANDCVGAAALTGRRFASNCGGVDDCNDVNASVYRLMSSRGDADADGYCAGAAALDCVGGAALAGRRFEANCQMPDDCNDGSASVFRIASVRQDSDADGWCAGNAVSQCIGSSPPSGLRLAANCQGDDCRDTNSQATSSCTLVGAYTTNSRTQTCPNGAQSFTLNVLTACPLGFTVAGTHTAQRLSGMGQCIATSETTITQTCNFLEGSVCRIVGNCVALPQY